MVNRASVWRYFDIWLVAAVLLLTAYGILIIRSAVTGAPAFEALPSDQVRWAIIGIVIMMVVASVDYRVLTSAHWYICLLYTSPSPRDRTRSRMPPPA